MAFPWISYLYVVVVQALRVVQLCYTILQQLHLVIVRANVSLAMKYSTAPLSLTRKISTPFEKWHIHLLSNLITEYFVHKLLVAKSQWLHEKTFVSPQRSLVSLCALLTRRCNESACFSFHLVWRKTGSVREMFSFNSSQRRLSKWKK